MSDRDRERILSYYRTAAAREWDRLDVVGEGAIEMAVTTRALSAQLGPGDRVLDIGGGPGRYAIWLAQRGHPVTLADLSPELLAIARQRVAEAGVDHLVTDFAVADACDLSRWPDGTFDAVLSLGPFYHLVDPGDRDAAARELVRVLRPGGLAFVAFMPRQAFLRRTLCVAGERHHLLDGEWLRRLQEDGVFVNDQPGRFDCGYGARPEEIEGFFLAHGLGQIELLAVEGIASGLAAEIQDLLAVDGPVRDATLNLIAESARDRWLLAAAGHLLYIGRRT